jgi:glycine hydroxymethyltransferase
VDLEIQKYIALEEKRQKEGIELIASENYVSSQVLAVQGSCLTNKYAEGYPGKRYYHGCEYVDATESLAISRAQELFSAENYTVNVQPHSGTSANLAVYFSCLKPGEKILAMSLKEGGHLSHGTFLSVSSKIFPTTFYGLNNELLDYDLIEEIAKKEKPKLIIAGASAYSRTIDFKKFSEIAKSVGAYLLCDIAHIAGLVATGYHPSPFPFSDFVTTTTHKTLRGPRGGMIFCKNEHAAMLQKTVFPGLQGGPLAHVIAAKAVSFYEALQPSFKVYQQQILKNAKTLSLELQNYGFRIISQGTDNHLMLVETTNFQDSGKSSANILLENHITCNQNSLPNDPLPPLLTSGIRLGVPAITTRGMREDDMKQIAFWIYDILCHKKHYAEDIQQFAKGFELYV